MANIYNNDKVPLHDSADEGNVERNFSSFSEGRSSAVLKQSSSSGLHMSHRNTVGRIPSHDQDTHKQRGIDTCKPKCPKYREFAARLSSFKNWPVQINQTPEQMTKAGFFFTGIADCVRCFVCGGKVHQWNPTDDPWTEHCRLFPLCSFAREQKGDHFITQTQEAASADHQENGLFGYDIKSNLVEQMEVRMNLEAKRGAILEMGYDDLEFKKVVWHFRNLGIMTPTLEELVEALITLNE